MSCPMAKFSGVGVLGMRFGGGVGVFLSVCGWGGGGGARVQ